MLDNIVGQVRKWQAGSVHWQATVVSVEGDNAWVQISSKGGKAGTQSLTRLKWTAGELADHGFDVRYE